MKKPIAALSLLLSLNGLLLAQPNLVQDLNPATADGFNEFNYAGIQIGSIFLLPANDGSKGEELYQIKNGAFSLLKDLNPGSASGKPSQFVLSNGKVYFSATGSDGIPTLWQSDGTASGTQQVAATASVSLSHLVADKNGVLYFDSNGEVYYYDPASGESAKIEGLPYITFEPDYSTIGAVVCSYLNGIVVAVAGNSDLDFWKIEGPAATKLYSRASPGFFTDVYGLTPIGDDFLFTIDNSVYPTDNGLYVYQTDISSATRIVNAAANEGNIPRRMKVFSDSKAIFMNGSGIYVTDGTQGGTVLLHSGLPSLYQGQEWNTALFNGKMLFEAEESFFKVKIMVTNATAGGTTVVATTDDPFISPMFNYNGNVWWASGTSNFFSPVIWRTDMQAQSSSKVYSYTGGSPIKSVIPIHLDGNKLFFLSNMGGVGRELYTLNVPQSTSVFESAQGNYPYSLTQKNNAILIENKDLTLEKIQVSFCNTEGRLIKRLSLQTGTWTRIEEIPAGVYFIQVKGEKGRLAQQVWLSGN